MKSSRMHQKMIRPFAGSSLLEIALKKVQDCKKIKNENIYLGAYDEEIKEIGRKVGIKIYDRSLESVTGDGTKKSLYEYIWDINGDYWVEINSCNPMLSSETIDKSIEFFDCNNYKSLFSVVKRKNWFFNKNKELISNYLGNQEDIDSLNTKYVDHIYEGAHSIYIWSAKRVRKELKRWDFVLNDPYLYEIPEDEFFDIDYQWQFDLAEKMYLQKHLNE